jgi:hypothetical protein
MKTDQVQARSRHQRRQTLHEFQRRHPDMRGAVAPRALELQHDVTRALSLEPFVGDRGTAHMVAWHRNDAFANAAVDLLSRVAPV